MDLKLKDCSKLTLTDSLIRELEYIQSSEGQYIIIPLKPTSKMTYECHAEMSETSECTVFMSRTGSAANQLGIMLNGSKKLSLRYHNAGVGGDKNYVAGKVYYRSAIENNKYAAYYNDTKAGETNINNSFSNNYNICIFGRNTAGTIATYPNTVIKLYDLKFYNNDGDLVMDLVPCKDSNEVVCLYDIVSETCYYNSGSGDFIAGPPADVRNLSTYNTNLLEKITSLYVKDCPNILEFNLLSKIVEVQANIQEKLSRVRLNIGNQSGSLSFLMKFIGLHGFNDNYEQQAKPRLIGTYTINDYYFPDDLSSAQQAIDGLTIIGDNNYALSSETIAIQTLDSEAPNYNPAVAIILANNGIGTILEEPKIEGGGRYYLPKAVASNTKVESLFANISNVVDDIGIVSDDLTQSFNFISFIEFKFFFPLTANANVAIFYNCSNLEEIEFPEGIIQISKYVAAYCPNLKKVVLPKSYTSVDNYGFYRSGQNHQNDNNYNQLWFNGTFEEYLLCGIGNYDEDYVACKHYLYINNTLLGSINIPNNITTIKRYAFAKLKNTITTINLNNVSVIEKYAFWDSNISSITFPNSVTSIGENAFLSCTSMAGVIMLPNSITNIDQNAFNACTSITGVTLPVNNSFTSINKQLFCNCTNLTGSLIIPNNVTSIGENAFRNTAITSLVLSNNLITIGKNAFNNCTHLTGNLIIPSTVTTINSGAFDGCKFTYIKANVEDNNAIVVAKSSSNICHINGDINTSNSEIQSLCNNLYINGFVINSTTKNYVFGKTNVNSIRINGNYTGNGIVSSTNTTLAFGEINGQITNRSFGTNIANNFILHLGYNGVACTVLKLLSNNSDKQSFTVSDLNRYSKIYVGQGISRTADQAILNLYLAESDWSQISSKLDIWYDYHGDYRNYNPTYNLINVTCSNVLEWPYPIRNDSYETELIPDTGYTLSTVQVTMLDTDTTSPTYDTMVDITNDVYDASTHTINVPAITGDIVITATAI